MGLIGELGGIYGLTVKYNQPMQNFTTFGVGGNSRYLALPKTVKALKEVIEVAKLNNLPYKIIGNGSNILFSDKGYNGVIVCPKQELFCIFIW